SRDPAERGALALRAQPVATLLARAALRGPRPAAARGRGARGSRRRQPGRPRAAERARLFADGPIQPPQGSPRLHPARARDEPRQRGNHRQHGLGAVQARRVRRRTRLPRARLPARARSRDRGTPRRRTLAARRARQRARAAAIVPRAQSREPPPPGSPRAARSVMRGFVLALAASLACACVRLPVGTDGLSYDTRRAVLENVTA